MIYSKKYFWFGSEAIETKDLASYLKAEKAAEVAHHVVSWASETGQGLLFYGDKAGDKSAPHGVIHLVRSLFLLSSPPSRSRSSS